MKVVYAKEFVKEFKKLPVSVQRLYRKQEDIFRENWRDPRLKVKKLKDHPLPFSFRITRSYRVLFLFVDSDTALFAGDHDTYRAVRHLPEMLMSYLDEPFGDEEVEMEAAPKPKTKSKET